MPIPDFTEVASAYIAGRHYDESTNTLSVRFKDGKMYAYSGVSPELAAEFAEAKSLGSFFHAHIRKAFTATQIEEEKDDADV